MGSGRNAPAIVAAAGTTSAEVVIPLTVTRPRLWWPRGYGDQPLYRLTVDVFRGGALVDSVSRRVGIKQSRLILRDEKDRDTFVFEINGRRVWVAAAT